MNVLPREKTAPWESDCRRCGLRVLGVFDQAGQGAFVDALPVVGGNVELHALEVGFRMRPVTAEESTERYVRHQCAKGAAPESPAPSEAGIGPSPDRIVMPFGKHRGECLSDIPRGYLRWALLNADIRSPGLRRAIERVAEAKD